MMNQEVIDWLLDPEDPSVRYRTLIELLDRPLEDSGVAECKSQIPGSSPVKELLGKMHPDGYWLQTNPRTKVTVGDGIEYGAYGTTHFCLSYLAELGMDRTDSEVSRAAERYLSLQKADGDFYRNFSCLIGYNVRTFIMLGYGDDEHVEKSIKLMLGTDRQDGGYLCDMHEGKYKSRPVKSCIRGSVKALLAFSYLPESWGHDRVERLVEYFLYRDGIYRTTDLDELVNMDIERNSFPITWRANVFEILLSMSKMGYGNHERLRRAWDFLDGKQDNEERYILDWTPSQSPWKVGKRNEPNKWITFYAYLAKKYREN